VRKLSLLVGLALLFCAFAVGQGYDRRDKPPLRITQGPVVESVGHDWAMIAWSTNEGGSSLVHYGMHRDRLDRTAQSPYVHDEPGRGHTHRVKVQHLRPDTTYYFVVDSGQGQGTGTEDWSRVSEFTTR